MKFSSESSYKNLLTAKTSAGTLAVWESTHDIDVQWDAFLASLPHGHFNQSSMWGQVRKLDGWQPLIFLVTLNDALVGGFQILWRSKPLVGKIGFLLKGPVVAPEYPEIVPDVLVLLQKTASKMRFRALIIQPADHDDKMPAVMQTSGFSPNYLDYVIKENTVRINLSVSEEEMFKRIKRTKRQNINTAIRSNIRLRQGSRSDLETFFHYMSETCSRQQVKPSPANIDFLYKIWDLNADSGKIQLFLAELDGEIITCLITLALGKTLYLWKFGWSGGHAKFYPNIFIYWEIFKWGKANGFLVADLGAISNDLAHALWNNDQITHEMHTSYSYMKTSLGGDILPLSKGFVYIYNPLFRWAYTFFMPFINTVPALKKRLLFGE